MGAAEEQEKWGKMVCSNLSRVPPLLPDSSFGLMAHAHSSRPCFSIHAFIFIQLTIFCSTIALLRWHLCSTAAGFSLCCAPAASLRPLPVSEGGTITKELLGCFDAGGMNGRWSMVQIPSVGKAQASPQTLNESSVADSDIKTHMWNMTCAGAYFL